jgi:hypothetical protein
LSPQSIQVVERKGASAPQAPPGPGPWSTGVRAPPGAPAVAMVTQGRQLGAAETKPPASPLRFAPELLLLGRRSPPAPFSPSSLLLPRPPSSSSLVPPPFSAAAGAAPRPPAATGQVRRAPAAASPAPRPAPRAPGPARSQPRTAPRTRGPQTSAGSRATRRSLRAIPGPRPGQVAGCGGAPSRLALSACSQSLSLSFSHLSLSLLLPPNLCLNPPSPLPATFWKKEGMEIFTCGLSCFTSYSSEDGMGG